MGFGGIASHNDNKIRVLDVGPGICHCTTAECWAQTGHRWAVSDTRLVVEDEHSRASNDLVGHPGRLVRRCRRSEKSRGEPPVHGRTTIVLLDEVSVAVVLHQPGDAVKRVIPGYRLELVGAGL